jgi:Zn-dependent peptidase ImmA (M78 family)/DNA-binding XRE family transcriptional regulator
MSKYCGKNTYSVLSVFSSKNKKLLILVNLSTFATFTNNLQNKLYVCSTNKSDELKMLEQINPNRIILAREARGLTQQHLADKLQLHKANISRLENGETVINNLTLTAIANATTYPTQFFLQQGQIMPVNLAYRRRTHVASKVITPIQAQINIIRQHVQFITRALSKPVPQLPIIEVNEKNTPAKIASIVRKKWNLSDAIIPNLTKILEQQGIIISTFNFNTDRVDSRSMLTDDNYPIIFLNNSLLGDRQRFSLAYELGHLIIHTFNIVPFDKDIHHQANLFAAEFLLPAKEIANDFNQGITLPLLGELKRKWKVSMIALLYRADDLGFLTPNQKRYLVQQFNQQKIRRREPQELDIPAEKPKLMRQLLANYSTKNKLTVAQMAAILTIEITDYIEYYG